MRNQDGNLVMQRVMAEQQQTPETRRDLLIALEKELERPVVLYFTSFVFPVSIVDKDVDILAGTLQMMDLSRGLALLISSPGGEGLAAERFVKVCRSYSGTGEYWAVVPGKAKSAATMICLGASKILMGPSSELGPVDPQLVTATAEGAQWFSAYNVVQSYKELFQQATETKGNLEPFLQQLSYYDPREIREHEAALALSQDIAIRALATGVMKGCSEDEIKKNIELFLTPEAKKTHGRPIYRDEAERDCKLQIERVEAHTKRWQLIYELYIRTDNFVSTSSAKCIEAKEYTFATPRPSR